MSADKTPVTKAGGKRRLQPAEAGTASSPNAGKTYVLRKHGQTATKTFKSAHRTTPSGSYLKVSVTMPEQVLEEARLRAGRGGLSAYVTDAVEALLAQERLQELIHDLDAEYGPVSEDKIAEAAAAWPSSE